MRLPTIILCVQWINRLGVGRVGVQVSYLHSMPFGNRSYNSIELNELKETEAIYLAMSLADKH